MSDPTDPGGVTGQHERARQTARVGDSGSPVGSPLTIVLAVIAVVVGFLIFRSIDDGSAGGVDPGASTTPTTATGVTTTPGATTATTAAPTTAAPQRVTEGATVIVANASSASQVASAMTQELDGVGYTMAEPTNALDSIENLAESVVHFLPGVATEQVAQSVARDLGGVEVTPMPEETPIEGSLGTATVLVMLGDDVAGQSIEEIGSLNAANPAAPAPAATTATTAG